MKLYILSDTHIKPSGPLRSLTGLRCVSVCAGAFLLPYCLFALLCGVPIFLLETVIGQHTQEGAMTCWTKLCPLAQGKSLLTEDNSNTVCILLCLLLNVSSR